MERSLRTVLLTLLAVLCLTFSWQFINAALEYRAIWASCNEHPGFSCDAVPQYTVGGFHFFSFILFTFVFFSRRYFWIIFAVIPYISLHVYGTYLRIGTGFFGGDMCPNGHPCMRAIQRASWFDWTAAIILIIALLLTLALVIVTRRSETLSQ